MRARDVEEREGFDVGERDCATCGRPFAWRKKWARAWPHVRFCSARCRRGLDDIDRALEARVHALVVEARGLVDAERALETLPPAQREGARARLHDALRRLALAGEVELVVRGRVVPPRALARPVFVRAARPR